MRSGVIITQPSVGSASPTLSLPKHIPALDGLRGIAIILVLAHHFLPPDQRDSGAYGWFARAIEAGWLGVDLFFVLSGFLITGILLDTKPSANYYQGFFGRRALRIFPLYYAVLFVLMIVIPLTGSRFAVSEIAVHYWPWLVFYGANILIAIQHAWCLGTLSLYWSLAVEEHFYLVWPFVVKQCSVARLFAVCLGMVLTAVLLRLYFYSHQADPLDYFSAYVLTPCRCDSLVIGGLVALAARRPNSAFLLRSVVLPLASWSGGVLLAMFVIQGGADRGHWFWQIPGFTLAAIAFAGAVATTLPAVSGRVFEGIRTALSLRILRAFGKYSYSLYILHQLVRPRIEAAVPVQPFIDAVGSRILGVSLYLTVVISLCLPLSMLSWYCFEQWFIKLKDYFTYREQPTRQTPAADRPAVLS